MKIVKKNSAHFWLRIRCDHQKLPQLLRPALNKPDSNLRDFWNFRIFVLTINFRKRMVKTLFFWRKCDKWAVSFEHFYIFEAFFEQSEVNKRQRKWDWNLSIICRIILWFGLIRTEKKNIMKHLKSLNPKPLLIETS